MFGGYTATEVSNELWAWDGKAFYRLAPAPVRRFGAALWYDRHRRRLVIHGGFDERLALATDTWVQTVGGWRQLLDAGAPPSRVSARRQR